MELIRLFQFPSLRIIFVRNVRVVSKTQHNIQNVHQGLIHINFVSFPPMLIECQNYKTTHYC